MVVENSVVVEAGSDCEVIVGSGETSALPLSKARGASDVADPTDVTLDEVLMVFVA